MAKTKIMAIIIAVAALAAIGAIKGKGVLANFDIFNFSPPVITNAFLDKEKYFPGDMMTITAETENADSAKAFVENEKGFNEVSLVVSASFNGKETWTGKWKVVDSVTGKKYKLKIVVSNNSGTAEKILEWEDPSNPGHAASSIDPGTFAAGDFVFPGKLNVNDNLTVQNGKSISLGGVARSTWPTFNNLTCTENPVGTTFYNFPWDGTKVLTDASCPVTDFAVGGGCIYGAPPGNCSSPYFGVSVNDRRYYCGCNGEDRPAWSVTVVCCR